MVQVQWYVKTYLIIYLIKWYQFYDLENVHENSFLQNKF